MVEVHTLPAEGVDGDRLCRGASTDRSCWKAGSTVVKESKSEWISLLGACQLRRLLRGTRELEPPAYMARRRIHPFGSLQPCAKPMTSEYPNFEVRGQMMANLLPDIGYSALRKCSFGSSIGERVIALRLSITALQRLSFLSSLIQKCFEYPSRLPQLYRWLRISLTSN